MGDLGAVGPPRAVAGDDDVPSAGEHARQAFERLVPQIAFIHLAEVVDHFAGDEAVQMAAGDDFERRSQGVVLRPEAHRRQRALGDRLPRRLVAVPLAVAHLGAPGLHPHLDLVLRLVAGPPRLIAD